VVVACLLAYLVRCPPVNVDLWAITMLPFLCIATWAIDGQDQPIRRGGPFRCAFRNRNGRSLGASSRAPAQRSPSGCSAPISRESPSARFCKPGTCAEMKTNKHKTLLLAKGQGTITWRDLMRRYEYSAGTARSYLSHLGRQGLLERANGTYALTEKGHSRIRYFAIFGCRRSGCPHCLGKLGHLTCPNCEYRIPRQQARIRKQKDYLLVLRPAGVYCEQCSAMILDEAQAKRMGIRAEE
jgi:hypothetical protein